MRLSTPLPQLAVRRWRLVTALGVAGVVAASLTHVGHLPAYTSATRFTFSTDPPTTQAEADADIDEARALATSPTTVRAALGDARVRRDPGLVATREVSVTGVGSSGIVSLKINDPDPGAALAIADALTARVLRVHTALERGRTDAVEGSLDRKISALSAEISSLQGSDPRTIRRRNLLMQRKATAESERIGLLASEVGRPRPTSVSSPTAPRRARGSGDIIGGLLGGIVGVGLALSFAAASEALRPVVKGSRAVAAGLQAPLLADLPGDLRQTSAPHPLDEVAARIRLAAAGAAVGRVSVLQPFVGARQVTDLPLRLEAELARSDEKPGDDAGTAVVEDATRRIRIRAFDPRREAETDGDVSGIVVLAPRELRQADLQQLRHILAIAPGPVLGVVTHRA